MVTIMKNFIKIFSLILCVCFCFLTGCTPSDIPKEIVDTPNSIGEFTIFTHTGIKEDLPLLFNLGHSYLAFTNTSANVVDLSGYACQPNEMVCIGTWSISQHFGVWYNVESNYNNHDKHYEGRLSLTKKVTSEDIATINEYIKNNNTWNPLKNCSNFALNCWNSVAKDSEKLTKPLIYTPKHLANEIKKFDNYEIDKPMNTKDTFGWFDDSKYVSHTFKGEAEYV